MQKAQSITADKQEDSEPIPEYFPPLPIYPPEEVNPVEAALNSFIEETNSEQNSSVQREEQFVNDVNAPVAPPAEAPFIADNTDSGIAGTTTAGITDSAAEQEDNQDGDTKRQR